MALAFLACANNNQKPKTGLARTSRTACDDLGINAPLAGTISNTPDNWVQGPEDESEATNRSKQLSGAVRLGSDSTTTWDNKPVDDDEVGDASNSIVSPLLAIGASESCEETKEDHDEISDDGDGDVGAVHACEESKVEDEKRSGECPVDVAGPEDLTEDVLHGVGGVLVGFLDDDVGEGVSVSGGHGEVGD